MEKENIYIENEKSKIIPDKFVQNTDRPDILARRVSRRTVH